VLLSLAGCRPADRGIEVGSRSGADTAAVETEEQVAITTASDEARALYLKGRELSDQLRFHDARQQFEQAAAKDPAFALAHYDLATSSGSPKEFLAHLDQAVKLSAQASDGERLMIQALKAGSDGDSRKSLELTEELAEKYPRDARALTLLGLAYGTVQEFDKQAATLERATQVDPKYSQAWNLLGYARMSQRDYGKAEEAFKHYIALVPSDPNPYDSYAELLMRTGRFDESIAQYRKALSADPHFSNAFAGIAANLTYQGRHDAAAAEAQKLYAGARDDGDRRTALLTRATIYVDQGRTAKALQEMDRLYALDAKLGDTAAMSGDAVQMGDILIESGRAADAAKQYQRSLELVEKSGLSPKLKDNAKLADHFNQARLALAKRDMGGAKKHAEAYRTGAEATGDVARIRAAHEMAGKIALEEKDFDGAIAHLGQADQQDPYVLYQIARAYQGSGDAGKAKEAATSAAKANTLPSLRYAFVRGKASKIG
jgi:tetratricopeptide (TPR) repeat protein